MRTWLNRAFFAAFIAACAIVVVAGIFWPFVSRVGLAKGIAWGIGYVLLHAFIGCLLQGDRPPRP